MAFETVFWIVVALFFFLLAFTIIKKLIKLFIFGMIILLVFSAFTGYSLVNDFKDFGGQFKNRTSTFLLVDNNHVLAGFTKGEEVSFLSYEQIIAASDAYAKNNLDSVLGTNYKLIIITTAAFNELPMDTLTINNKQVPKSTVLAALIADDTAAVLSEANVYGADIRASDSKIKQPIDDNNKLKAGLFAMSFAEGMKDSPMFLFREFKKGNIIIYKETILFKAIKIFPIGVFDKVAGKIRGE